MSVNQTFKGHADMFGKDKTREKKEETSFISWIQKEEWGEEELKSKGSLLNGLGDTVKKKDRKEKS